MATQNEMMQRLVEAEKRIREIERNSGPRIVRSAIGGGGGSVWKTAATKGALPSVNAPWLGYVTSTERCYVRHGDSSTGTWDSLDHLE